MSTLVIIDYGSGNLHSAAKAFERASREGGTNTRVLVSSNPVDVAMADRVVLPGVGAFADCKRGLDAVEGMHDMLETAVRKQARPFLGICVGMQLMAAHGLEHGVHAGLGWVDGDVAPIEPSDRTLKIPHMGWNTLSTARSHPLLEGIATGPAGWHAYFVHSYHMRLNDRAWLLAETDYGGAVTAMIAKGNMAGTQFHPEKSQKLGLQLIANFLKWTP